MRILAKRQVKELMLYSPQHIAAIKKRSGNSPSGYTLTLPEWGGVEDEVLDWLGSRAKIPHSSSPPSAIMLFFE